MMTSVTLRCIMSAVTWRVSKTRDVWVGMSTGRQSSTGVTLPVYLSTCNKKSRKPCVYLLPPTCPPTYSSSSLSTFSLSASRYLMDPVHMQAACLSIPHTIPVQTLSLLLVLLSLTVLLQHARTHLTHTHFLSPSFLLLFFFFFRHTWTLSLFLSRALSLFLSLSHIYILFSVSPSPNPLLSNSQLKTMNQIFCRIFCAAHNQSPTLRLSEFTGRHNGGVRWGGQQSSIKRLLQDSSVAKPRVFLT